MLNYGVSLARVACSTEISQRPECTEVMSRGFRKSNNSEELRRQRSDVGEAGRGTLGPGDMLCKEGVKKITISSGN